MIIPLVCAIFLWTCAVATEFSKKIIPPTYTNPTQLQGTRHFVIVIASYNNQEWCERNILSALSQDYPDFEIIFTDDNSNDTTYEQVEAAIAATPHHCQVTLVKNHVRLGALQNIYRAISWCKDSDVIVSCDGDDWFPDGLVLSRLHGEYSNPFIWITHGQLQMYPSGEICSWSQRMPAHVVRTNSYRQHQNIPTHLRTFYAGLFRKIQLQDLLFEGKFFPMTWDMAFMIPMMELSAGRSAFISKVMYVYNESNPINDHKVNKAFQRFLDLTIRAKKRYQPLRIPPYVKDASIFKADVVIEARNNTANLYNLLQHLSYDAQAIGTICVLYDTTYADRYTLLMDKFPHIKFQGIASPEQFKSVLLLHLYKVTTSPYILLATDNTHVEQELDLKSCMSALQNTQAYGFYLATPSLNTVPELVSVDVNGSIRAWQFGYAPQTWINPGTPSFALYNKETIRQPLQTLEYTSYAELEQAWSLSCDSSNVGLFFAHAPAQEEKLAKTVTMQRPDPVFVEPPIEQPAPTQALPHVEQPAPTQPLPRLQQSAPDQELPINSSKPLASRLPPEQQAQIAESVARRQAAQEKKNASYRKNKKK